MISISVIVPFRNERRFIERCARSLLEQEFDNEAYEVIFIDNGSTDDSTSKIKYLPRIRLLVEEKTGSYAARNAGIQAARGEIIAFTDADCEVAIDWLNSIKEGIESENVSLVLGKRRFVTNGSRILKMVEDYENAKIKYILGKPLAPEFCFAYTNNMAVRLEVFDILGPFPEVLRGGDTEFIQACLSCDRVSGPVYLESMEISHLQIANLMHWLMKQVIRGKNNRRISTMSPYRKLGIRSCFDVFLACLKEHHYGNFDGLLLLSMLVLGNVFYWLGEALTFMSFRFKPNHHRPTFNTG